MQQQLSQERNWWQRRWWVVAILAVAILVPTASTLGVISTRVAQVLTPKAAPFTVVPFTTTSPVALENQQPGTTAWMLDPKVNTTFIQGYAGMASAVAGDTVPLYISTVIPVDYTLDVYRMGWYDGTGGRLMLSVPHLAGQQQGTWSPKYGVLGCRTCTMDRTTHLFDAHWQPSYDLYIQPNWLSGVYLIKLSVGQMAEAYIPLVVRDDGSVAQVLLNIPVMTYQAYNLWGGYSLYGTQGKVTTDKDEGNNTNRAFKVSFNRPYDRSAGAGDFLAWDIHTIRWFERSAIDVTYTTDVDVSEDPSLVQHHRVYVAAGHNEYWTLAMRNGIEAARDAGVNLAFLGADDAYWQARLEPDSAQNADRTVVCYKVNSASKDPHYRLSLDPMYPAHPELVTSQWRDPVVGRPENSLLGLMYSSYFSGNGRYRPDLIIKGSTASNGLLARVGLQGGQRIRSGVLGYEYDTIYDNGLTPPNLVVLAESPVVNTYHEDQTAYTAYYRASSGALVFDAGSIWWSYGLDSVIAPGDMETHPFLPDQAISDLTATILLEMLRGPTSATAPLEAPPVGA